VDQFETSILVRAEEAVEEGFAEPMEVVRIACEVFDRVAIDKIEGRAGAMKLLEKLGELTADRGVIEAARAKAEKAVLVAVTGADEQPVMVFEVRVGEPVWISHARDARAMVKRFAGALGCKVVKDL